ncbi:YrzI family small protein [Aneurinibacillus sp. Ricciae_BoGa-3]|nr:YrzI family small protein [Aneurinibacillus sp. Ricciae_BoGa-3]WCK54595.1 YrzI family small protein [Aneurinibacillus sp. Ricciae_BoGa-3]
MFTIDLIYFTITVAKRDAHPDINKIERDNHVAKMMKEVEEKRYEYMRFM